MTIWEKDRIGVARAVEQVVDESARQDSVPLLDQGVAIDARQPARLLRRRLMQRCGDRQTLVLVERRRGHRSADGEQGKTHEASARAGGNAAAVVARGRMCRAFPVYRASAVRSWGRRRSKGIDRRTSRGD